MEQAKLLRRTIGRLAKEVNKHHDRISVNAMLELSAQIKRSSLGTVFFSTQFHPIRASHNLSTIYIFSYCKIMPFNSL
jgi:hypothetical protein